MTKELPADDPLAIAVTAAITQGDLPTLHNILSLHPDLPQTRILSPTAESRTLLHIATDWPGHFPNIASTITALASAGCPVSAPFHSSSSKQQQQKHAETPLHWAASSNDVAALTALLNAGADLEAPGAVLGGGAPLADAVGFKQWDAARLLVERGARATLAQAAALGMVERVEEALRLLGEGEKGKEVGLAFWYACHGGQLEAAKVLLAAGADVNWSPPWAPESLPLDVAREEGPEELVGWLLEQGAVSGVVVR